MYFLIFDKYIRICISRFDNARRKNARTSSYCNSQLGTMHLLSLYYAAETLHESENIRRIRKVSVLHAHKKKFILVPTIK